MGIVVKKTIISAFLILLGGWLLSYSWQQRQAELGQFDFTMQAAQKLAKFPQVQYQIGYQLWFQNRLADAAVLLRRAVAADVFLVDAWIKLGEIDAERGNQQAAGAILDYTDRLTRDVYRWKWSQAMIALKLGAEDIFVRNVNGLIPVVRNRQNALFVIDDHFNSHAQAVLAALDAGNVGFYLDWLMGARRVKDAQLVWAAMNRTQQEDPDRRMRYIDFLIGNRQVAGAKKIWGHMGVTNPGFEKAIGHRGFYWRMFNPKNKDWKIKRVLAPEVRADFTLQVRFAGKDNINFYHLYQIVPVASQAFYRLQYEWRSLNITTDQGPFVEVYGLQYKGLYQKGAMIRGTEMWRTESIDFKVPAGCEAVVVRLRRVPSKRFDSKIEGKLWLDNFTLKKIGR